MSEKTPVQAAKEYDEKIREQAPREKMVTFTDEEQEEEAKGAGDQLGDFVEEGKGHDWMVLSRGLGEKTTYHKTRAEAEEWRREQMRPDDWLVAPHEKGDPEDPPPGRSGTN